jgi:hypothetical protein
LKPLQFKKAVQRKQFIWRAFPKTRAGVGKSSGEIKIPGQNQWFIFTFNCMALKGIKLKTTNFKIKAAAKRTFRERPEKEAAHLDWREKFSILCIRRHIGQPSPLQS